MTLKTHFLITTRTTTWAIDSDADVWIVKPAGAILSNLQDGIVESVGASNNTIDIQGEVRTNVLKENSATAILAQGDGTAIGVAANANVEGYFGIMLSGSDQRVVNDGVVHGGDDRGYGVYMRGDKGSTVVNSGSIVADTAVFVYAGINQSTPDGETVITNTGTIYGVDTGVETHSGAGDYLKLVNKGLLKGEEIAYSGDIGSDRITNSGTIAGDVVLAGGNDYFLNKGGRLIGNLYGGDGDDTLTTTNSSLKMIESANKGYDTVYSSANYALNANVEQLLLAGGKNINGDGNEMGNAIDGNAGANRLRGFSGSDTLWGHAGNDVLIGGGNGDIFVFSEGDGRDRIADFQNGSDLINLSGWTEMETFADVRAHLRVDGDDIVISAGGDSLRLTDVDRSEINKTDFIL
ncbi:calcium-binding protein [Rhizobium sp. G21]|uniref:calcium-binding protein n=1 Tax=Rhizobium sp. G21 TaxID=2758439 RepID=UPI0016032C3C|nr:calcium-binding protein [Rhizobium sp. G21]MBB1248457.1 calcium-binding protein [Rhizobium sp. G21]